MSKKIVIANWKMNPANAVEAKKLYLAVKRGVLKERGVDVVVCPPSIFLPEVAKVGVTKKIQLGAQDTFYEETGAYTGQISPRMVKGYKAKYTILGHSERRALGESNELEGRKLRHALDEGMSVVLCVGESNRADDGDYYRFVREEIETALMGVKRVELDRVMIAYEPIWAIGKRADEALDVPALYEMVLFIRKVLTELYGRAPASRVPVLYGGSVKESNAKEFITEGGVQGLLVGGASLCPEEFLAIISEVK